MRRRAASAISARLVSSALRLRAISSTPCPIQDDSITPCMTLAHARTGERTGGALGGAGRTRPARPPTTRPGRLELRLFLQLVPLVIYELQQDTVQRFGVDEGELTIPEGTGPSDERIPLFLQLLHGLPRVIHVEADQHDAFTVLLYVLGHIAVR